MIESNNISLMPSDFEQIKKLAEDGLEYWTSGELCNALGYSTYQKFTRILTKAIAVANCKGMKIVTKQRLKLYPIYYNNSVI